MPVNLDEQRAAIAELIPEAIERAIAILRHPTRNAIAQLNVIKLILDRGGIPAIQDVQISGAKSGEPVKINVNVRYVDKPAKQ